MTYKQATDDEGFPLFLVTISIDPSAYGYPSLTALFGLSGRRVTHDYVVVVHDTVSNIVDEAIYALAARKGITPVRETFYAFRDCCTVKSEPLYIEAA